MTDTKTEIKQIIEELEQRRDGNGEKAETYRGVDEEKRNWFKGIETGYNGALEVIREELDYE